MPYQVVHTGISAPAFSDDENAPLAPWMEGQIIDDKYVDAHPFKAKLLRVGGVRKVSEETARAAETNPEQAKRLAEVEARLAELQAERDQIVGTPMDATAPAAVKFEIDPANPPTGAEAAANRAAGHEVIQPTPGDVVIGEVVPGEAADKPKAGRK